MEEMDDSRPARPSLVLRLGITGARNLGGDQLERIRGQLKDVFGVIKAEMDRLSALKEIEESYAPGPGGRPVASVYLITPLALGADRMAAREALDHGCEIYVPMPFPQEVYEQDFAGCDDEEPGAKSAAQGAKPQAGEEDCAEFRQLLSRASGRFELDGARSATPDDDGSAGRAYEAVGRFVVRHCDLLLAVWDGGQSKGRGGTAEIVHYAAAVGVPVWWIHAQKGKGPWTLTIFNTRRRPNWLRRRRSRGWWPI
jgi:hypothetical protein